MSKNPKNQQDLEVLDTLESLDTEKNDEESTISNEPPAPKPKRQLTEKQKEALKLGRQKGRERLNAMHAEIQMKREAHREELERTRKEADERLKQKTVKKALQIKKKELLAQVQLDQIEESDDDIPIEVVRKIISKQKKQAPVPKPRQPSPSPSPIQRTPITPPRPKFNFV